MNYITVLKQSHFYHVMVGMGISTVNEEIESCKVVINELNSEMDFVRTYTRDFQRFSDIYQARQSVAKQLRMLEKKANNLNVINKRFMHLN